MFRGLLRILARMLVGLLEDAMMEQVLWSHSLPNAHFAAGNSCFANSSTNFTSPE